jgi:MFS family permease
MSEGLQNTEVSNQGGGIYAWYVVVVLMLCYALSFIDRQILSLLVEPIKADLGLSDTEFSLLQGMSFAIFYTFVGLYMGKLADTRNRRNIIVVGITAWSVMTACCGFAKNFTHLFMARVGVAVGEATLSPAAYSITGDYFRKEQLARAMSTYSVGVFLGSGLAFVVGGALIASVPSLSHLPLVGTVSAWQMVFIVVGLAGIPFVLLVLTIREPTRGRFSEGNEQLDTAITVAKSLRYFAGQWRFYAPHFIGFSMLTTIGYAFHSWIPAFFIRTHSWTATDIGLTYGTINIVAAPLGVLAGGWLGDKLAKSGDRDAFLKGPILGAIPLWVLAGCATAPFISTPLLTLMLLGALHFFASFHAGMAVAALHTATPISMRSQATAAYLFVINLVGLGGGPLIVALMTDFVFKDETMIGSSLMIVGACATPIAILMLSVAKRSYRQLTAHTLSNADQ